MPLLGYKKRFADLVESGVKRQTFRPKRKIPIKKNDPLYHYEGLRTKSARKLGESVCTEAPDTEIDGMGRLWIHGLELDGDAREAFAIADGFATWEEALFFFQREHGLPICGQLIKWDEIVGEVRSGPADNRKIQCPRCGKMVPWNKRTSHECYKEAVAGKGAQLGSMVRAESIPKARGSAPRSGA